MKTAICVLLFFMAWWGWIALFITDIYQVIPDKWYITLPLFVLGTLWAFFMRGVAERYRAKK